MYPMNLPLGVATASVVATVIAAFMRHRYLIQRVAHILTGPQRRTLYPVDRPIGTGGAEVVSSPDVQVRRQLYVLKDGAQMFCQVMKPTNCTPSHVIVFVHGYTSLSDLYLEPFAKLARKGAVVVMPDLPCHGRSDGLLAYIPDWWAWVEQIWELLDRVVPEACSQGEKPLPAFISGMSLGGGLAACLAVQRPTFFSGIILIAPMLYVSDEIKPPWIVLQIFKMLVPLMPLSPFTPTKDMADFDFRVPEQGHKFTVANPLSMMGLQARLATAYTLAFTFPNWMAAKLGEVRTPILIMHGKADKITDPSASQSLYDKACALDKTIKLYDGAFHCELLMCHPGIADLGGVKWLPEQIAQTETCLNDISEWIARRIA